MIRNLLITTFRYFFKYKAYSLINIFGLSIGLATCILIFLFVQDELSYDRFHKEASHIYRLESYIMGEGEESQWAATQGNLIPAVTTKYPEIVSSVKFNYSFNTAILTYGDLTFREPGILYADSTFFDVFSFNMVRGSKDEALSGPGKMVITKSAAQRYFGDEDPLGKILKSDSRSYMISGVIKDVPANSHVHFDLIVSLDDLRQRWPGVDDPGPSVFYSYIRLANSEAYESLKLKMKEDVWELLGYTVSGDSTNIPEGYVAEIVLNPLTNIHLNGHAEKEIEDNSDIQNTYIFSSVALLVLLIACINYMNLATARSATRGKEIGVKKVLGANRSIIFNQFMAESFFMSFFAMAIALLLVDLILPYFNDITGKSLQLDVFSNIPLLVSLISIWILVSFISGSYPALYLSQFNPLKVLYGNIKSSGKGNSTLYLRRGLVIFQFSISVLLIIEVITVYKQLKYIRDRNPGFDKENVIVIPLAGQAEQEKKDIFKNELRQYTDIISVSGSNSVPGMRIHVLPIRLPDLAEDNLERNDEGDDYIGIRTLSTDLDVMSTFGLSVVQGRGFSADQPNDAETGFLLNEAAIDELQIEDPVGKRIEYVWRLEEPIKGHIIGVVKNFNYASVHNEIEPLMIHVDPKYDRYMSIRVKTEDIAATIQTIEKIWSNVFPTVPFDYFFLDSFYENMYKTESNIGSIVLYFTLLAILIACLGLIGLASYITEQRTKEIGIRKVLGANIPGLIKTFSKEFIMLVFFANLIAWVPAWYFLNRWLDGFVYRTGLSWWLFLVSGLASLIIALLIVGFQSYRAGQMNPVDAIKAE